MNKQKWLLVQGLKLFSCFSTTAFALWLANFLYFSANKATKIAGFLIHLADKLITLLFAAQPPFLVCSWFQGEFDNYNRKQKKIAGKTKSKAGISLLDKALLICKPQQGITSSISICIIIFCIFINIPSFECLCTILKQ